MAKTLSTMLPLGTTAQPISLLDARGERYQWDQLRGKQGTLVMFICNHCPYVIHLKPALAELAKEYQAKGFGVVAINSNDYASYPDDAPKHMLEDAEAFGYSFPYLVDETQEVAQSYKAACTPDFFVFDKQDALVYRGQFDDSRPGNDVNVTGSDLRNALDAILAGEAVATAQKPSLGCNIKWRPGAEPSYFGNG